MTRIILKLLFIIITLSAITTTEAKANPLKKWLPELFKERHVGTEDDPAVTLIAPFAKNVSRSPDRRSAVPLNKPHRSEEEIAQWLNNTIAILMSFQTSNYLKETQSKAPHFDETGWEQFSRFLQYSNLDNAIRSDSYEINTIVNGQPLLLNKGEINGSYKWLYEIGGMITYKPPRIKSYENTEVVNQDIKIQLQIGRHHKTSNEHNLLIEQWDANIIASK